MHTLHEIFVQLAANRIRDIGGRHIAGSMPLVILATCKPIKALTGEQLRLVDAIKELYCIEGDYITLNMLTNYIRQDISIYTDLLNGIMERYIRPLLVAGCAHTNSISYKVGSTEFMPVGSTTRPDMHKHGKPELCDSILNIRGLL